MLDFVNYLKENFKEDVSSVEKIIQTKWEKVIAVIKEAFDYPYSDKKTALYKIQNEFINPKLAPKTIDVDFLKNNMDYVLDKINSLDEGDVKIIINTGDVQKGGLTRASITGMETEGKKSRKDVVKEETDEVEDPADMMGMNGEDSQAGTEEEEKVVKVSVADNKVTVEPSENTGLEKSEHEFETDEDANEFVQSLENLFKGFKVEKEDSNENVDEIHLSTEESIKIKKKLVAEDTNNLTAIGELPVDAGEEFDDVGEEPEDAGEESEDAGEEPEDAGEEPEDAGEEPEDAGEEPEDAGEFDWEDIMASSEKDGDAEECIAPVRPIDVTHFESRDIKKLINTLVKVDHKWYKVGSITENNEVICVDKDGNENSFDLEQIEEMEQNFIEPADEFNRNIEWEDDDDYLENGVKPFSDEDEDEDEDGVTELQNSYPDGLCPDCGEPIPNTAVNGDSCENCDHVFWVVDNSDGEEEAETKSHILSRTAPPIHKEKVRKVLSKIVKNGAEEETEEPETQEESLSFAKMANRWMDLEEDSLSPPSMLNTQAGGMTSMPGVINQKIEPIKPAPKSPEVKGPTNALTASPKKPDEKIDKIPSAPTLSTKKGPTGKFTSNPKAPPKKIEKIKAAPKIATKASPSAALTKSPSKPKKKIEKVKAPNIDSVYKKGGFKG